MCTSHCMLTFINVIVIIETDNDFDSIYTDINCYMATQYYVTLDKIYSDLMWVYIRRFMCSVEVYYKYAR